MNHPIFIVPYFEVRKFTNSLGIEQNTDNINLYNKANDPKTISFNTIYYNSL